MARGLFRQFSIGRMIGAYRSQLMRSLLRLLTFGFYGKKGMGWIKDPKKAWYNWIYYRTSISIPRMLGYKPSRGAFIFAMVVGTLFSVAVAPFDWARAGVKASKIKKSRKARSKGSSSGRVRSGSGRGKSYGYSYGSSSSSGSSFSTLSDSYNSSDNSYESSGALRDSSGNSRDSSGDLRDTSDNTRESSDSSKISTGTTRKPAGFSLDSSRDTDVYSDSSDAISFRESKPKAPPKTTTPKTSPTSSTKKSYSSSSSKTKTEDKPAPKPQNTTSTKPKANPLPDGISAYSYIKLHTPEEPVKPVEEVNHQDENAPKSKPLNVGDQYIRKRMIIAGNYYCDQDIISQLSVGAYFQFVAEPSNQYDKNAVALYFQGGKIGYVAKQDVTPIATCLKLGRNIYGVITDIQITDGKKQIEYEAWISVKR